MMICSKCGRTFDETVKTCPFDNAKLFNGEEDTMMSDASEATMIGSSDDAIPPPEHIAIRVRDPLKPRELRIGDVIGDYRIEEQIGQGGMATVYRCVNPFSGKQVAVKILHPKLPSESAAAERFIQEARAINQIGHRNIVDILQFDKLPDGRHYLVMELFRGVTLQKYLTEHPVLVPSKVTAIIKSVASALESAHGKGYIHRDLKPENIILERPDSDVHMLVKLLDFGAAKYLNQEGDEEENALQTKTGIILGTPDYMSPEQCNGDGLDYRTDIYSLGMVAYQCLTGHLPFTGDNFFEVMSKRMLQDPPLPSELAPHVDPAFNAPLMKALSRNPDDRYQRAGELAYALEVAAYQAAQASGRVSQEELAALVPPSSPGPSQMMHAVPRRTTQQPRVTTQQSTEALNAGNNALPPREAGARGVTFAGNGNGSSAGPGPSAPPQAAPPASTQRPVTAPTPATSHAGARVQESASAAAGGKTGLMIGVALVVVVLGVAAIFMSR